MGGRAMVTKAEPEGNMAFLFGTFDTVREAKRRGELVAHVNYPDAALNWETFSPTTWGLMAGRIYTGILVTRIPQREETP